ncbi:hypothetical protein FOL75_05335 [Bacillus thuringiensis]|nr:hypothetical protein [Bacillus thuringiensis]OTZ30116.1 hypothetical protein BK763_20990 [Bacillus thuringiensis serovar thompsoni]OTZ53855.1 hypothetical protein BK762_08735 [Bacillus thuringiensis serovar toumanoffi]
MQRFSATNIHLPPKIGVSHLHTFEEGVFCRKTIKLLKSYLISSFSGPKIVHSIYKLNLSIQEIDKFILI